MSGGKSCGCPDCRFGHQTGGADCPEAERVEKLERDRALLLLAVRSYLEDNRIDTSIITDSELIDGTAETFGDSQ
jgi:hypothetical protein